MISYRAILGEARSAVSAKTTHQPYGAALVRVWAKGDLSTFAAYNFFVSYLNPKIRFSLEVISFKEAL